MADIERVEATSQFGALQDLLLSSDTLDEFLREITIHALGDRQDQPSCGITVRGNGRRPYTIGSSDGMASRLDEAQYAAKDGPCLHALSENVVVDVPRIVDDQRWPTFRERAMAEGAVASLSLPMASYDTTVGALNLYARDPAGVGHQDSERAARFASRAGGAVALAVRLSESRRLTEDLQGALASRTTINQALGILMSQQRCTVETAFDTLRRASQHRNVKLREVAAGLIEQVSGHPPQPGPTVH